MTSLTPMQHLTRAENIYARFSSHSPMLPAEHSAFLLHICEALKAKLAPLERREVQAMLDDVVHEQGIPGVMYGHNPLFRGETLLKESPMRGRPMRDFDGRWNMHPDMLENGEPVIIIWQHEEDREWERNQEYVEAFRFAMGYGDNAP